MTLAEAEATLRRSSRLIGLRLEDREVTNLAIMPDQDDLITEIANCLIDGNNYKLLLNKFHSFDVIVYYDLQDLLISGLLKWDYLDTLIKKIGGYNILSTIER